MKVFIFWLSVIALLFFWEGGSQKETKSLDPKSQFICDTMALHASGAMLARQFTEETMGTYLAKFAKTLGPEINNAEAEIQFAALADIAKHAWKAEIADTEANRIAAVDAFSTTTYKLCLASALERKN